MCFGNCWYAAIFESVSVKRRLRTADCRLRITGKMQTECKMQTNGECATYFDKEARCVTAKQAYFAVRSIDLDFRLTERWGESKNDSIQ